MEQRTAPVAGSGGDLHHLLRPTLEAAAAVHQPLYSVRAGFLVAFFGGVHATLAFSALNSRRANRLAKDLWIYLLAGVAWAAALIVAGHGIASGGLPEWLDLAGTPQRTVRWGGRLVALGLFGLVYLRHRPLIKAQELLGDDPPNPWPAGLVVAGLSIVLTLALVAVGAALGLS